MELPVFQLVPIASGPGIRHRWKEPGFFVYFCHGFWSGFCFGFLFFWLFHLKQETGLESQMERRSILAGIWWKSNWFSTALDSIWKGYCPGAMYIIFCFCHNFIPVWAKFVGDVVSVAHGKSSLLRSWKGSFLKILFVFRVICCPTFYIEQVL